MGHIYRVWIGLLIALVATFTWAPARAQEPEPAPEQVQVEAPQPADSGVAAILATKPATPLEMVRAAKILAGHERPDLARDFLKKVLAANLDEQQLIALRESLGPEIFTEMASRPDLAPEAQQLGDAVLAAVGRHRQDSTRLAAIIAQLQDPSADTRYKAFVELRETGAAAVWPLTLVLADPGRAAEHAGVRAALVALGSDAVGPLTAVLESQDPKLIVEAVRVLGELKPGKVVVFLVASFASDQSDPEVRRAAEASLVKLTGQTPSKQAAIQLLAERAEEYFERLHPLREHLEGQVLIWTWDADAKQPVEKSYLAHDASLAIACRFARDAYSVAPENGHVRVLYLATMLEQAAYEKGLENPLETTAGSAGGRVAAFGPEVVEEVLAYALKNEHPPTAAAAARILGEIGKAETLLYQGPQPAPLVQATWHADRRVRFAAVEAILRLDPSRPFPGSSRVTEALLYFAASGGRPRALVAARRSEEAGRVGGYLAGLGYELDTATTARDAIRKLLSSPDYELALVDAGLQQPTVDFMLQQLRHDCRTAGLPVGVTARSGQLDRARHLVRRDPLAQAFSRPHTAEAVQWQVERLMGLLGRNRVLPAEREHQAAQSMKWLADLTGRDEKIYDLSRAQDAAMTALSVPRLAPDAVIVLGNLGTPQSQRALVELASRWTQPFELRLAAARAFRESIHQSGILLTTEQIMRQYDRYNQSETLDLNTQQVLGLILDYIEAPTRIEQQVQESAPQTGSSG